MTVYDISNTGSVTKVRTGTGLIPSGISWSFDPNTFVPTFGDFDIDHYNGDEPCHLVLYGGGTIGGNVVKLDGSFNILNSASILDKNPSMAIIYNNVLGFFGLISPGESDMTELVGNTGW
ncbi:MAG TPA: hypothetical protein VGB30_03945 [bacterium]